MCTIQSWGQNVIKFPLFFNKPYEFIQGSLSQVWFCSNFMQLFIVEVFTNHNGIDLCDIFATGWLASFFGAWMDVDGLRERISACQELINRYCHFLTVGLIAVFWYSRLEMRYIKNSHGTVWHLLGERLEFIKWVELVLFTPYDQSWSFKLFNFIFGGLCKTRVEGYDFGEIFWCLDSHFQCDSSTPIIADNDRRL